jgi:hypothetical protein
MGNIRRWTTHLQGEQVASSQGNAEPLAARALSASRTKEIRQPLGFKAAASPLLEIAACPQSVQTIVNLLLLRTEQHTELA